MLIQTDKGLTNDLLMRTEAGMAESVKVQEDPLIDTTKISVEYLKKNELDCANLISFYIKRLLSEWGVALQSRPDDEKRTMQGKLATVNHAQSTDHLKPLFKGLRKQTLPKDVVARIAEICDNLQKREYMMANDAYIRLSIGNAPWPIGVGVVGN